MKTKLEEFPNSQETGAVIAEVRSLRDAYAVRFGYDLTSMVSDLQTKESEHPERCAKLLPLVPSLQTRS